MKTVEHGEWKISVESIPDSGMYTAKGSVERKRGLITGEPNVSGLNSARYTAKGTVERSPAKGDVYGARYTFKNLGVSDTSLGVEKWALEWLQGWLDENF
ncbi:hypothetical protein [Caballeronia sp. LjRoot31]|uniref:hypothetical protein n=1 Tax=Caballeronia sp. LjRoot31 TaxID=3342324 RepID=UPI003ECFF4EC